MRRLRPAIHSTESLNHSLPWNQVGHHVVGIEIDANLSSRRGNQERRQTGLMHGVSRERARQEALKDGTPCQTPAFEDSTLTDEELDSDSPLAVHVLEARFQQVPDFERSFATVAEHEYRKVRLRQVPGTQRDFSRKFLGRNFLQESQAPPKHLHAAIVSRIKIMAELNIAERRVDPT